MHNSVPHSGPHAWTKSGSPPAAETRSRPESVPKNESVPTRRPAIAEVPSLFPICGNRIGIVAFPPESGTFSNVRPPLPQKASHCPSGEKAGCAAPSVPGTGLDSISFKCQQIILSLAVPRLSDVNDLIAIG